MAGSFKELFAEMEKSPEYWKETAAIQQGIIDEMVKRYGRLEEKLREALSKCEHERDRFGWYYRMPRQYGDELKKIINDSVPTG